jgi:PBP1b-binding outer membrane lipoprotein LpoB
MKKLNVIRAIAAGTALLSACSTPQTSEVSPTQTPTPEPTNPPSPPTQTPAEKKQIHYVKLKTLSL